MPFIREPFYNREKTKTKQKIHNRPTKNVIYYRTFLQQRKKDDKQKICGWQKKMTFITEPFLPRGGKKTCINLTKSKVAIYSDYKSSPDAIIYWRLISLIDE